MAWRLWPTSNVRFYPDGFSDNPPTVCSGWEVRELRAISSAPLPLSMSVSECMMAPPLQHLPV